MLNRPESCPIKSLRGVNCYYSEIYSRYAAKKSTNTPQSTGTFRGIVTSQKRREIKPLPASGGLIQRVFLISTFTILPIEVGSLSYWS